MIHSLWYPRMDVNRMAIKLMFDKNVGQAGSERRNRKIVIWKLTSYKGSNKIVQ